jgi:hypothetical protein
MAHPFRCPTYQITRVLWIGFRRFSLQCKRSFMALHDRPPFSSRPSLTGHCGHCWTCSLARPVAHDLGCVKTRKIEKSRECFFVGQLKSDSPGNVCATIGDLDERFFCRHRARLSFYTAKTLTRHAFGLGDTLVHLPRRRLRFPARAIRRRLPGRDRRPNRCASGCA